MNAVPPPSSLMGRPNPFQKNFTAAKPTATGLSKHGYSTMDAISQFANSSQYALGKRKTKTEDEYACATSLKFDFRIYVVLKICYRYFDDDEEAAPMPDLAYIPAPGSPSYKDVSGPNIFLFVNFI